MLPAKQVRAPPQETLNLLSTFTFTQLYISFSILRLLVAHLFLRLITERDSELMGMYDNHC